MLSVLSTAKWDRSNSASFANEVCRIVANKVIKTCYAKLQTVFIWKSVRFVIVEELSEIHARVVRIPPPITFVCAVCRAKIESSTLQSECQDGVELFLASRFSQSSSWDTLTSLLCFVIRHFLGLKFKTPG